MAQSDKKVVKLRIQVPANVEVITEVVDSNRVLALEGAPVETKDLVLDLTTKRTAQWLNTTESEVSGQSDEWHTAANGCACCVRG